MKQKVLEVLKPLVASKGFKKAELEGLADLIAKNLTDASTDEEINNAVSGVLPYADLMQKIGNRYAADIEKKYEGWKKPEDVNNPTPPKPPTPPTNEEHKALTAEEIQKLIAEGIANGLKPYQEREEKNRLQALLFANEKVKTMPESFRSRYTLDKEENLDTLAAQMEADYASLKQELLKSGEFATPPTSGGGQGSSDDLIAALQAMGAKATKK
jgi:hypothetical protein